MKQGLYYFFWVNVYETGFILLFLVSVDKVPFFKIGESIYLVAF